MASYSFIPRQESSCALTVSEMEADYHKCHIKQSLRVNGVEDDRTTTIESLPLIDEFDTDSEADDWEPATKETLHQDQAMLGDVLTSDDSELTTKASLLDEQIMLSDVLPSGCHNTKLLPEGREMLQTSMDRIFKTEAASLLDLNFSFAIADAELEGCPLIGCSTGFTSLSGHEMADVAGWSCSSLVNSALSWEQVDGNRRQCCQDFLLAAKQGTQYKMPSHEPHDEWFSELRPCNELISVQTNTHKDGRVFNSMTLMKIISLGDFDNESNYILAVQSEVPGSRSNSAQLRRHLGQLDKNMAQVLSILGQEFIVTGVMDRQCK